jgi:hypothetical protein
VSALGLSVMQPPNARPLLRTAAAVILVFCCAAPFVLLFSSLVAYGVSSFIH